MLNTTNSPQGDGNKVLQMRIIGMITPMLNTTNSPQGDGNCVPHNAMLDTLPKCERLNTTNSPQGDGNNLLEAHPLILNASLVKHHQFPARGRKRMRLATVLPPDLELNTTNSPQGDGNELSEWWEFSDSQIRLNTTNSPQGDGNLVGDGRTS